MLALAGLTATALAYAPALHGVRARTLAPPARTTGPTASLLECSSLLASVATPPPGFEGMVPPGFEKPHFGDYMMNAAGMYVLVQLFLSFAPVIKERVATPDRHQRVVNYLSSEAVPLSDFTWHHLDMRNPLPNTVEALVEHPIGVHNGRQAFLCHAEAASKFYEEQVTSGVLPAIEVSKDFSDFYNGERVYVCYR